MALLRVAILTISDSAAKESTLDKSGPVIREILKGHESAQVFDVVETRIVSDSKEEIAETVKAWSAREDVDWIITSGGTGFGTRDRTPEVNNNVHYYILIESL